MPKLTQEQRKYLDSAYSDGAVEDALMYIDELEAHVVELRAVLEQRGPFHDEMGDCSFCDLAGANNHQPGCAYVALMAKTDPGSPADAPDPGTAVALAHALIEPDPVKGLGGFDSACEAALDAVRAMVTATEAQGLTRANALAILRNTVALFEKDPER